MLSHTSSPAFELADEVPEPELRPDGTVFPPVTPDPPGPPGYVSPVEESATLEDPWRGRDTAV